MQKMSKSEQDPNGTVNLLDRRDDVIRKFKKAVTDSGSEILYTEDKPGIKNLMTIYSAVNGKTFEEIERTEKDTETLSSPWENRLPIFSAESRKNIRRYPKIKHIWKTCGEARRRKHPTSQTKRCARFIRKSVLSKNKQKNRRLCKNKTAALYRSRRGSL